MRAVVYDLNEPGIVSRFEKLGKRLQILIDNDGAHGKPGSAETQAAKRLAASAGAANVKRQHMGKLQHNKIIVVDGDKVQATVCGSTNHSWRGFFVQNNNAIILRGKQPVKIFRAAFDAYWNNSDDVAGFGATGSAIWNDLKLKGIDAQIGFSPRSKKNAVLDAIAKDIGSTTSSLFFSLAFLYQTPGAIRNAVMKIKKDNQVFSYGISDHKVPGLSDETSGVDVQKPDGQVTVIGTAALTKNAPEPFKTEPTGGERRPPAPQVRRHRLRQADGAGVHGLLQLLGRRRTRPTERTCYSSRTGGSPLLTSSRRSGSSTTTISAWFKWKRRTRRPNSNSPSRRVKAKRRGGKRTTRTRARSAIASCSPDGQSKWAGASVVGDALVGHFCGETSSATRGSRADEGVRPTRYAGFQLLENYVALARIGHSIRARRGHLPYVELEGGPMVGQALEAVGAEEFQLHFSQGAGGRFAFADAGIKALHEVGGELIAHIP